MEDLIKEIKEDVKEIKGTIGDVSVTLAKNTESLTAHMARTLLNEARIEKIENWILGLLTASIAGLLGLVITKLI